MSWYAQTPARAARQITTDLAVLAWAVLCGVAGKTVHAAVAAMGEPALRLRSATATTGETLARAREQARGVPVIGDRLQQVFDPLTATGADVDRAAADFVAAVDRAALAAGLAVALLPLLAVAMPWLVARLRFARRSTAAQALLRHGAGRDLFALRALADADLGALLAIDPDPAGAWRRGDEAVLTALADLELRGAGLRAGR